MPLMKCTQAWSVRSNETRMGFGVPKHRTQVRLCNKVAHVVHKVHSFGGRCPVRLDKIVAQGACRRQQQCTRSVACTRVAVLSTTYQPCHRPRHFAAHWGDTMWAQIEAATRRPRTKNSSQVAGQQQPQQHRGAVPSCSRTHAHTHLGCLEGILCGELELQDNRLALKGACAFLAVHHVLFLYDQKQQQITPRMRGGQRRGGACTGVPATPRSILTGPGNEHRQVKSAALPSPFMFGSTVISPPHLATAAASFLISCGVSKWAPAQEEHTHTACKAADLPRHLALQVCMHTPTLLYRLPRAPPAEEAMVVAMCLVFCVGGACCFCGCVFGYCACVFTYRVVCCGGGRTGHCPHIQVDISRDTPNGGKF